MDKPKRWTAFELYRYKNGVLTESVDKSLEAEGGVDVTIADEMDKYNAERDKHILESIKKIDDHLSKWGYKVKVLKDLIAELESLQTEALAKGGEDA